MTPVKNIIFDLGGVFLNLDTHRFREAFNNLGIPQITDLFRIGHAESIFKQYETGHVTDSELIAAARRMADPGTSDEDIINAWNSMLLDFPPERVALLQRLKNKYRLFLFSNTNSLHLHALQETFREEFGMELDSLFEKTWYSHLINHRKPDVEAFQFVLNDAALDAAETLFIDDAMINVEGAKAAGLQTKYLEPGMTVLDLGL